MTTHSLPKPQARHWDIHGLRLTGLEWGAGGDTPVLMLHGWMDHAESFKELAPRLTGCHVIALDLSGQGLSDHRAAHATYNIWDDLPQILGVLDQLGWRDCILISHSRGANISSLLAATQPDRVRGFIGLDSLVVEPTENSVVTTLRAFVEQTQKQLARAPRTFASRDDYVARRQAQGNAPHVSEALADRALEEGPDGFRMRGDARLFASSAMKLTPADVEAVLRAIQCPVLNIWAQDGIKKNRPKIEALVALAQSVIPSFELLELAGDHHFHLDPKIAEEIAQAVLDFMDRHALSGASA